MKNFKQKIKEKDHHPAHIQNKQTQINTKNTPYLIIVESPSKCKKIEKFLGFQYKCIASNGHIRTISSITTKTYEPMFEILPLKKKHVENMRDIISNFAYENIFLGTDDDREGEAIAWHICIEFGLPIEKIHRIIFHEITEEAIKQAVQNPLRIRMNIVLAQHARQVLDRLVGFQISPLLTKRINSSEIKHLSAGRCQTPALRLVYDRELKCLKDTMNENEKQKYQIIGYFFSQNSSAKSFSFPLKFILSEKISSECISFLETSKDFKHELILEKPQEIIKSAPIPFNTSSLLQTANIILQLSSKDTMLHCQQLYQNGYITYMRTESTKYSNLFLKKVRDFIIEKTNSQEYLNSFSQIENTDFDCPHEAIHVTNLYCTSIANSFNAKMSEKEKEIQQKVYQLIWQRSVESCMSDYRIKQITARITSPIDNVYYIYVVDIPLFLGWKWNLFLLNEKKKEDNLVEEQARQNALFLFLQCTKSPIKCMKIECDVYINEKNRHYTEAGLIKDLEEYGIGRPSTFSIILQCIQERNYVVKKNITGDKIKCIDYHLDMTTKEKQIIRVETERIIGSEKNKLVLQELGKNVIEELIPTFEDLFSYDYTKKMEIELDKILLVESEYKWNDICSNCDNTIKKNTRKWKTELKQIYKINTEYELLFTKTGAVIRNILDNDNDNDNDSKKHEYKKVKQNIKIDFDKLQQQKYNLEELLEIPNDYLGEYEGYPLYLKNGQYGLYVTWGDKKESISSNLDSNIITIDDVIQYLSVKREKKTKLQTKHIIRILNDYLSIRKGKYGVYIHYEQDKTAQFYNLKLFPGNYLICEKNELLEWIENTYGII